MAFCYSGLCGMTFDTADAVKSEISKGFIFSLKGGGAYANFFADEYVFQSNAF